MNSEAKISYYDSAKEVSFFRSMRELKQTEAVSIRDIAEAIICEKYAAYVHPVRDAVKDCLADGLDDEAMKKVLKPLKDKLPCWTLSGVVSTGPKKEAMQEGRFLHSGAIQVDIDHQDLQEQPPGVIRDIIGEGKHMILAALSPSRGVKGIMLGPICKNVKEHKRFFAAVEETMLQDYEIKIDESTSDPVRICYVTSDPGAIYNPDAIPLTWEDVARLEADAARREQERLAALSRTQAEKPEVDSPPASESPPPPREEDDFTLLGTPEDVRHVLHAIPNKRKRDEWLKVSAAVKDALGSEEAAIAMLEEWCPGYNSGEYEKAFRNPLIRITKGSLVSIAQDYGFDSKAFARQVGERSRWNGKVRFGEAVLEEELTPFPTHCLPGAAGDMAREIGRVTTAQNEPLAAASVLTIVSAAIGAGIELSTGGERRTRGNLFTLAIAESGTGKGEAYKLAAEPFETLEAEEIEAFDMHTKPGLLAEISVADKRAKTLCSEAAKETDSHARILSLTAYRMAEEERAEIQRRIDSAPRWKVADVTREALAVVLAGQPGEAVASLSSEARGIFSIVKGRYGKEGGDEDLYCSAYSGDSINIDRVGRARVSLRRPCMSILWMVQPDAARNAFNDESFTDSGFLPRFLIFDPKAEPQERYEQPAPIPPAIKAGWSTLIRSLATTYRMNGDEPQAVSVSRDALALLTDYERENVRRRCRKGDLVDLAPFVARWTENAWKIALVLHAARHGGTAHEVTLDAGTAENALEVMRWFANRQLETLSAGRREKLQKRLMALMAAMAAAKTEISFWDLKRSHSFEESEIRQLKTVFPKAFKIEERRAGPQRTSAVIMPL